MNTPDALLITSAALAAGAVNALAGGGTLISFPALTAAGLPAVAANVTNTVALCPGYFGATLAQRKDLRGQGRRMLLLLPAAVLGGLAGGILLVHSGERFFRHLIPYLILMAAGLLAAQGPLRRLLIGRAGHAAAGKRVEGGAAIPAGLAAVYGGYFGAGLSVIFLAVLGLTMEDTLTRLNALKQVLSLSVNVAAAVFFLFSGKVVWPAALLMAAGALLGGMLGGRLAGRVKPEVLRWIVVAAGIGIAAIYLIKG